MNDPANPPINGVLQGAVAVSRHAIPRSIDHIALAVHKLDISFFQDVLGFTLRRRSRIKGKKTGVTCGRGSRRDVLCALPRHRARIAGLVQRKSFVSLNTSQITQAIVAGLLIEQGASLRDWIRPALHWYRANRDVMLYRLDSMFSPFSDQIQWNRPAGGFFLTLALPFRFGSESATECAMRDNDIVMPLSFFASDNSQDCRIRLAFSAATPEQIRTGVTGLGRYVARRMGRDLPDLWRGLG
ncbi:hypothetical protein NKH61_32920 [Mesorhizobium sp. M1005]|uniref:hypothetical protein n=1 Tax=unclassified Mesorhizobium TaxID=325217 RepID=UPI003339C5F8